MLSKQETLPELFMSYLGLSQMKCQAIIPSVQQEAAHNSNQPECAAIKWVPRATKAPSKLWLLLHCNLQDVTHLFNRSSTAPADNSPGRTLGRWSIVAFDGECVGTGIISDAANIQWVAFSQHGTCLDTNHKGFAPSLYVITGFARTINGSQWWVLLYAGIQKLHCCWFGFFSLCDSVFGYKNSLPLLPSQNVIVACICQFAEYCEYSVRKPWDNRGCLMCHTVPQLL